MLTEHHSHFLRIASVGITLDDLVLAQKNPDSKESGKPVNEHADHHASFFKPMKNSKFPLIHPSVLRILTTALVLSLWIATQVRAEVIRVRLLGQNSLFSAQDSAAISTELNSILSAAAGSAGSSATTTVLGGRSLTEGFYHPTHRVATRAALIGNYDYLVILPETGFLAAYPEVVFEGVLQMSRRALNAGATPLLLMPGNSVSEVSNFGPQVYRIANGCGIDAVPGAYATQAGGLLGATSSLNLKRQAYLLAATLFTKITGLNAAAASSYAPTDNGSPIDFANLAGIAESTLNTRFNSLQYSGSRETTGRVRYRPITPANNLVRYAWTGTSTETGIKDALNPMLLASGYALSERKVSGSLGWDATVFEAAKPIFDASPNQYLFAYGRTSFINLSAQSLVNYNQANLIPFNFDRHFNNPGKGIASINGILDDVFTRTDQAEQENKIHGWAAIPFHLGAARLNDVDSTLVFSSDDVHVTSPLYNMMASMMLTSALGREPTPTASILASPQDLKGFNVGKQIIKQLAFLAESEAFVPDTRLAIVGTPSIAVTKGLTVDHTFTATHGTPPFTWREESTLGLPPGLTLSSNGRLSGITSANPNSWQLVLNVKDSTGAIRKLPQTLTVTALPAGTSAFLSSLTPSTGSLAPSFDSDALSYTTTVHPATSTITITPIAAEPTATIRVNGIPVASGSSSGAISLDFGPNLITTEIVSQDLTQTKTYTLTVTRAAFSSNADLAELLPSDGTLSPPFTTNTLNYVTTVSDISQLTVTPTAADAYAIIRVNGNLVNSGSPSGPIALITGSNPITIEVQSSDLSITKTYLLEVTRELTNLRWWDGGSVNIAGLGDGTSQGAASGLWNTTTQNWDQGNGRAHVGWENTGAKTAIFGGTPGIVTAQNVTVGGMTFTSAYTVTGGNITFANSGTISNSAAVTISSPIGGTGPITKEGIGTLTLNSSSNAFTGGTLVAAGRLILENNLTGSPSFTINQGATLELRLTTNTNQLSQGTITGAGNLVKSGIGRLLLGAQNNPQTVSMTSGTLFDVQAGLIRNEWGNSAWSNNKADLNIAASAFFDLWDGNVVVDAITGSGVINKAWSGTNTLTIGTDHGSGSFSGKISNTNNHGGGYGGVGGGTLNLMKLGNGTQTLSGINTYTGNTTVSAGTLALVGGSQTSPIAVNNSASLGFTLGFPTTSTSSFNLTAGTIRITGSPTLSSHTLITASSGISGTPTLHTPIPGYALAIDGTSLKLVRVLSYAIWATTHAPTGTAADDYDGDGVANGLEYALGGSQLTNDHAKLPSISQAGNSMVITFKRNQASIDGATTLAIEVGTSLSAWPVSYSIPTTTVSNNPGVTVIKNSPVGFDTIILTIEKAADHTKFARLKVTAS